jgi:hypothetical protein
LHVQHPNTRRRVSAATHRLAVSAAVLLSTANLDLKSAKEALRTIANLFGRQGSSMSSFEMLKSGLVEELLVFASDDVH